MLLAEFIDLLVFMLRTTVAVRIVIMVLSTAGDSS